MFDDRLRKAQQNLNMRIVADTDKYVPFKQGALRGSVRYPEGTAGGLIEYNTPYAHYLYEGEVYGPNIPMFDIEHNLIGFFSPPSKTPTGRPLAYHEPGTGDHWFEKSKQANLNNWIKVVKDAIGGG